MLVQKYEKIWEKTSTSSAPPRGYSNPMDQMLHRCGSMRNHTTHTRRTIVPPENVGTTHKSSGKVRLTSAVAAQAKNLHLEHRSTGSADMTLLVTMLDKNHTKIRPEIGAFFSNIMSSKHSGAP